MQDQPNKQPEPRRKALPKHPGIYVRTLANGKTRYEVGYRVRGKPKFKTVYGGLAAAKAERDELQVKSRKGAIPVRPSREVFDSIAKQALVAKQRLRDRTREDYELKLRRVEPYIGHLPISDIGVEDISAMVTALGKNLAPTTVRNTLVPTSVVFDFAVRHGLCASNPVKALEKDERPKVVIREKRILTQEEIGKLLKVSGAWRPLFVTAAFTGARESEVLGLVWEDIDFERGVVHVRKQLSRKGKRVEPKTTSGVRDVPLMPALATILKEHRLRSPYNTPNAFVFTTGTGKPYGWSNVVRAFQNAVTKAKLGEVRFHNLRDFYASVLIHMGHDPVSVARQLGHSDATTTLRVYAREFDAAGNQEKIRSGLEARFGNTLETSGSQPMETEATGEVVNLPLAQEKSG